MHDTEVTQTQDPVQPKIKSAGDPMRLHVEQARGNPLRDNSEQAQSSHIDLQVQGEPEQSPDNEDQERPH